MKVRKGNKLLFGALCMSIDDIVSSELIRYIDEEITTAALLGAMASNIAWASALALDMDLPPLSWVHYSKHGKDEKSEAYTGADFALIFRVNDDRYRAAVFQAKRAQSEKCNFKPYQISPAREGYFPEPQILRLYKYGLKLLTGAPLEEEKKNDKDYAIKRPIDFVHYLIYHQTGAYAAPLCDYQKEINTLQIQATNIKWEEPISIESVIDAWKPYVDKMLEPLGGTIRLRLLLNSALLTPPTECAPGWIDLKTPSAVKMFISDTRKLMDVFEGSALASPKPTFDGGMDLSGMTNSRRTLLRKAWPKSSTQPKPKTTTPPKKRAP